MNAITVSEMRSAEEAAIRGGSTEEGLMDLAGERLACAIAGFFPSPGTIVAYLGKGHNAGDALVALGFLRDRFHWKIATRTAFPIGHHAPLTLRKFDQLGDSENFGAHWPWRGLARPIILLDGLVGIGVKGSLREPLLSMSREMNMLRQSVGAHTAAIDLPSGVDPDTGEIHPGAVIADITFMIGAPKRGLVLPHSANATGALAVVPIFPSKPSGEFDFRLITPASFKVVNQPRPYDFHKVQAGRVGILAGSPEYTGAAVLAAMGALRAGAGLVTLHVPADAASVIAAKCPPEIIVRCCEDPTELLRLRYNSLVIGCGLLTEDQRFRSGILSLIAGTKTPTVIDAEALNLFACSGDLSVLRENHIITPHPGEFARLAPDLANLPPEQSARIYADRTDATLLLKGCRTIVTRKHEALWFNPTGTPGMATGGQGDLLSGVIGALLAIGNPPLHATAQAAWLCGRAAERALQCPDLSPESLLPTDVIGSLGRAFRDWSQQAR